MPKKKAGAKAPAFFRITQGNQRQDAGRRFAVNEPVLHVQLKPPALLDGTKRIVLVLLTSALYVTVITPLAPTATELTAAPVMVAPKPADALEVGHALLAEANSVTAVLAPDAKLKPSDTRARLV